MLTGGAEEPAFDVTLGEVVRLHLTNTANTRVFDVALPGARVKLVGGDSGRYEREELVESVLLGPSERAILDVLFDRPGPVALERRTPYDSSTLATFKVAQGTPTPSYAATFEQLRADPALAAERMGLTSHLDRAPDKTLRFVGEMDMSGMEMPTMPVPARSIRLLPTPPTTGSSGTTRCRR
jgi:FtsP/CotA-like multicopper oxidase with cupredoxin domain